MALHPTLTTPHHVLSHLWAFAHAGPSAWHTPLSPGETLLSALSYFIHSLKVGKDIWAFPFRAPSASTVIFRDAVFRGLLFVHLLLHLTYDTELLEGRNYVLLMTEPPVPHTACHTVLSMY